MSTSNVCVQHRLPTSLNTALFPWQNSTHSNTTNMNSFSLLFASTLFVVGVTSAPVATTRMYSSVWAENYMTKGSHFDPNPKSNPAPGSCPPPALGCDMTKQVYNGVTKCCEECSFRFHTHCKDLWCSGFPHIRWCDWKRRLSSLTLRFIVNVSRLLFFRLLFSFHSFHVFLQPYVDGYSWDYGDNQHANLIILDQFSNYWFVYGITGSFLEFNHMNVQCCWFST